MAISLFLFLFRCAGGASAAAPRGRAGSRRRKQRQAWITLAPPLRPPPLCSYSLHSFLSEAVAAFGDCPWLTLRPSAPPSLRQFVLCSDEDGLRKKAGGLTYREEQAAIKVRLRFNNICWQTRQTYSLRSLPPLQTFAAPLSHLPVIPLFCSSQRELLNALNADGEDGDEDAGDALLRKKHKTPAELRAERKEADEQAIRTAKVLRRFSPATVAGRDRPRRPASSLRVAKSSVCP